MAKNLALWARFFLKNKKGGKMKGKRSKRNVCVLKDNVSFKILDKIAYQKSDNDFAQEMQKAKEKLFKNFKHIPQEMTEFTTFISCSYLD